VNPAAYGPAFIPVIAVIGALVHIGVTKDRSRAHVLTIALLWGLVVALGVGELVTAGSHFIAPDATAAQIGFPPGNPFQWEVACANLSFAVLGIACFWAPGLWAGTVVGYLVYFWGCGIGHIDQYVNHGNTAPYNWGPIVPVVFVVPAVLAILLVAQRAAVGRTTASGEDERPVPTARERT
jgi:uncharacterized protein DUF6790